MKDYRESQVIDSLEKKGDVRIAGNTVYVLRGTGARNDIGNGSKGKIDYLCNYCGYTLNFVTKFN